MEVEVVLVASMCDHDSPAVCRELCGQRLCCQINSFSFSPTAWSSLNVTRLHTYIFLMDSAYLLLLIFFFLMLPNELKNVITTIEIYI